MRADVLTRYPRGLRMPADAAGALGLLRAAAFWTSCCALLLFLHGRHGLDSDEGLVLNAAWNLLHGRTPYTDFFEYVAPGSFYVVFATWKLFGATYYTAKATAIVLILVAAAGVYALTGAIAREGAAGSRVHAYAAAAMLCVLSGYWPAINHNTFAVPLTVWTTYFVYRGVHESRWRLSAVAGVLCGSCVWVLQQRGAVVAATIIMYLAWIAATKKDRGALRQGCAFAAAFLAAASTLVCAWPPAVLADALVRFPAAHYIAVNRLELTLFFCAVALVLPVLRLVPRSSEAAWLVATLQVSLLLSSLQRPDLSHITPTLFPALALAPMCWRGGLCTRVARLSLAWFTVGLIELGMPAVVIAGQNWATYGRTSPALRAVEYVRLHCGGSPYLYAGPFMPGVYFETGKLNPSPYSILLSDLNTQAHFSETLAAVKLARPQCAVTNYAMVEKFRYRRMNVLDSYVAAHFEVVFQVGETKVWSTSASQQD